MDTRTLESSTLRAVIEVLFRLSLAVLLVAPSVATSPVAAQESTRDKEEEEKTRKDAEERRRKEEERKAQPVRKPPGNFLDLGGGEGPTHRQPVSQGETDVVVEIHPQADEAEIGKNFAFSVTVSNEGANRANAVSLQLSAQISAVQGDDAMTTRPAQYESVKVKSEPGSTDTDCTASGVARICDFGQLLPGKEREATVTIRLPLGLRPGELVLSATANIAGEEKGTDRKTVRLVPNARAKTDVDLTLTIEPSLKIVGPGSSFFHVIKVVNTSDRHDATNLQLQIFHRMKVGKQGGYELDQGFNAHVPDTTARCTTRRNDAKKEIEHRCELEKIAPQGEARVLIEVVALRELPAGKWGRLQTKARVRSIENDPSKGDNKALANTIVIPRLPEVVVLSRVPDHAGNLKTLPVQTLTHGQEFMVAARFMDPVVEVYGREIQTQLTVEGSAPIIVPLRFNPDLSDAAPRVYRSERFRLVSPGETVVGDPQGAKAISAPRGTAVRAVYTPPAQAEAKYKLDREGQSGATVLVVEGR